MIKFIVFPFFASSFLAPVFASGAWDIASVSEKVAACGAISVLGFLMFVACLVGEIKEIREDG